MASHLDVEDLVSLYAISKDFHYLVNTRFTTTVLSQSLSKAPESSRTFRFKAYKNLCMTDPVARPNAEVEGKFRMVPSFRWLRMVLYREHVVAEIIAYLAAEGHRLPRRSSLTLKKIWLTMDMATNTSRIGFMHNREFWTDDDLYVATIFSIKLDMRLTDPVDGDGETSLRHMLLAQRSLTSLWRALKRTGMLTQLEMLQMYVRWSYKPAPEHRGMSIVGVPANEVGKGQNEGWGRGSARLLRPDDLVMREGIRRGLDIHKRYMDMLVWGYIDPQTFEEIPIPQLIYDKENGAVGWARVEDDRPEETPLGGIRREDPDLD